VIIETLTISSLLDSLGLGVKIAGIVAFLFSGTLGVFRVINWVKGKFISINNNVIALNNTMAESLTGLREDIKHQTTTLSNELREQRADFRTFYGPFIAQQKQMVVPQYAVPSGSLARAKKTPVKKKSSKK